MKLSEPPLDVVRPTAVGMAAMGSSYRGATCLGPCRSCRQSVLLGALKGVDQHRDTDRFRHLLGTLREYLPDGLSNRSGVDEDQIGSVVSYNLFALRSAGCGPRWHRVSWRWWLPPVQPMSFRHGPEAVRSVAGAAPSTAVPTRFATSRGSGREPPRAILCSNSRRGVFQHV